MWKSVAVVAFAVLAGCTLGPSYRRPAVQTPDAFRAPVPISGHDPASLADLKWWEIFKDEKLQDLERTALTQNFDLRAAVARVEAARANVGIVRSNQFPTFAGGANISTTRISRDGSSPLPASFVPSQNRTFGGATLNLLSFEADIWGRLRRATESARAQLLSADDTRLAVVTTLVADVATAYFTMRELDYELAISQRTLATRQASLELIKSRQAGGVATLLDLRQGEELVYTALQVIPSIQLEIEQTENRINLLLGRNPGGIERGRELTDQNIPPDVPVGLPSALLERRPDILAAEHNLIAANAQIGVARAAYYPQITLSGFLGGLSTQLANLFTGTSGVWNFTPQITQPIFTAGRLKSNVKLSEALRDSALAEYEKAIHTSFAEVSDALIAHQRLRESRVQQELLVGALQDRTRLAYVRYRGGVDTLLNALDADRDQFQAELMLAQIRRSELLAIVQLYKALGGGWQ
jgi:NodT family efflux transporter outer membrane factor (OMF) lipoprotein